MFTLEKTSQKNLQYAVVYTRTYIWVACDQI